MTIVDSRTPDAIFMPENYKRGTRLIDRVNSVLDVAEPMLGVDRGKGERGYIRKQDGGWLFITKDPDDTIYHPFKSAMAGQPRYAWIDGDDGIRRGYLIS